MKGGRGVREVEARALREVVGAAFAKFRPTPMTRV